MEFGPRALGGRSIVGRCPQSGHAVVMNLKIKYRSHFVPVCASVLLERASEYFVLDAEPSTCSGGSCRGKNGGSH